jgi:hypothetical protein
MCQPAEKSELLCSARPNSTCAYGVDTCSIYMCLYVSTHNCVYIACCLMPTITMHAFRLTLINKHQHITPFLGVNDDNNACVLFAVV